MSWDEGSSIRQCKLLAQESIEETFTPREGRISQIPDLGELLLVTNQRVIAFTNDEKTGQFQSATLGEVLGVSVRSIDRDRKMLYQGLSTVFGGVLVYLILGYVTEQVIVALLLAAGVMSLGLLSIIRYLVFDRGGLVIFQVGSWEIEFPYYGVDASKHLPNLIHTFFKLKLAISSGNGNNLKCCHTGGDAGQDVSGDPNMDMGFLLASEAFLATPTTTQDLQVSQDCFEDHDIDESSHTPQS